MRTAADSVAFALGLKNEVKGTGPFAALELKREGAVDKAGGEVVSTAVFVVGLAALLSAVYSFDMASHGL